MGAIYYFQAFSLHNFTPFTSCPDWSQGLVACVKVVARIASGVTINQELARLLN